MLGAAEGTVLNSHPPRGHLAFSEHPPEASAHHKARQRGSDQVPLTASKFRTDRTQGTGRRLPVEVHGASASEASTGKRETFSPGQCKHASPKLSCLLQIA